MRLTAIRPNSCVSIGDHAPQDPENAQQNRGNPSLDESKEDLAGVVGTPERA